MRMALAALLVWGITIGLADAAPQPNCPTRVQVIDVLGGNALMSDPWLVMVSSSLVGLSGAYLGVPAGIVASVLNGGVAAVSGIGSIAALDFAIRDRLSELPARIGSSSDDAYEYLSNIEDIVATDWLTKVAGSIFGGIFGLMVPLGIGPFQGVGVSVVIGTASGVTLAGFWHRLALWPFHDDLPELCRSARASLRT